MKWLGFSPVEQPIRCDVSVKMLLLVFAFLQSLASPHSIVWTATVAHDVTGRSRCNADHHVCGAVAKCSMLESISSTRHQIGLAITVITGTRNTPQ